jgi:hypothetical protein
MADQGKEICMSGDVLYELWQENKNSNISESKYSTDSETNVTVLSCGEQSVSTDEKENVSDNSTMRQSIWEKSGAV